MFTPVFSQHFQFALGWCGLSLLFCPMLLADDTTASKTEIDASRQVAGRSISQYADQLGDTNRVVRLRAVKSLGAFGESAGDALQSALQNDDVAVQYIAAVHLGRIAGEPLKAAEPKLSQLASETESKPVRMATAFALCRLGKFETQLKVLTEALQHPDRGTVCSAAELLGMLGNAGEPAIEALEAVHAQNKWGVKGGDYHRGGAAMNALRKIRGEQ